MIRLPVPAFANANWLVQVDKDLRQMLIKEDAPPAKKIGVRVWPKAIPQFNVGHLEVVQVHHRAKSIMYKRVYLLNARV